MYSGCLITYPDSVTEEQLKADCQLLAGYGCAYSMTLSDLDENSKLYLYRHVYDMLPMIAVILVLAFVSSVSSAALTTRTRFKDYAVFCICGMRWKQSVQRTRLPLRNSGRNGTGSGTPLRKLPVWRRCMYR